jgi:aryl-alcohol dehydrogenase-like predicted oxidoreductase
MDQPRALCTDAEAVQRLMAHPYFQPHTTPIQIFNRATEPFLPRVKNHLFAVLEDLDTRGLRNHILVITRYRVTAEDCERLNELANLRVTLLFTYSGIEDERIEPFDSKVAAASLRLASRLAGRYRTVLYWRPLVRNGIAFVPFAPFAAGQLFDGLSDEQAADAAQLALVNLLNQDPCVLPIPGPAHAGHLKVNCRAGSPGG